MRDNTSKDQTQPAQADEVIDQLYAVAVDPSRYEALLDHWEAMIEPHRRKTQGDDPFIDLAHLAGHVERADLVLDRLLATDMPEGPAAMLAQIDRAAAFAVDAGGRIIATNSGAVELLNLRRDMALSELRLGDGDAEELAHTVGRLLRANRDEHVTLRARTAQTDRLVVFQLRAVRPRDIAPYVVVISSEIQWPAGFSDMLRTAFDFTRAESDVVRALTEGRTLQQIAEDRGRSVDTIRAQLKSVMSKTETRSQTELVRLTLSTMEMSSFTQSMSRPSDAVSVGYDTLIPRPYHSFVLPDGRRSHYLILGDPTGTPVLYLPLDYGLMRWPARAEEDATRRGLRIIVPVRAGYGDSTPIPKGTPYVAQIAEDMAALMDHLGVTKAPFLTLGGDSHLAFNFGQMYPDRITALVACAGVLPLTRAEQYERMDKWHRFILAGARHTPHLLPFMVKAGFALAKRIGKQGFVRAVYGNSPADVATFEDPQVLEAMVCGSEVCLSDRYSAHDAFSAEVIAHETTDWTSTVLSFKGRIPVTFLNGLQDPQVPPETLADFQRDYPWITFKVYPDAGQLAFFLKWTEALDHLCAALENG